MRVGVLGPLEVEAGGQVIVSPGARLRMLLIRLALDAGRVVTAESLARALWEPLRPRRDTRMSGPFGPLGQGPRPALGEMRPLPGPGRPELPGHPHAGAMKHRDPGAHTYLRLQSAGQPVPAAGLRRVRGQCGLPAGGEVPHGPARSVRPEHTGMNRPKSGSLRLRGRQRRLGEDDRAARRCPGGRPGHRARHRAALLDQDR